MLHSNHSTASEILQVDSCHWGMHEDWWLNKILIACVETQHLWLDFGVLLNLTKIFVINSTSFTKPTKLALFIQEHFIYLAPFTALYHMGALQADKRTFILSFNSSTFFEYT